MMQIKKIFVLFLLLYTGACPLYAHDTARPSRRIKSSKFARFLKKSAPVWKVILAALAVGGVDAAYRYLSKKFGSSENTGTQSPLAPVPAPETTQRRTPRPAQINRRSPATVTQPATTAPTSPYRAPIERSGAPEPTPATPTPTPTPAPTPVSPPASKNRIIPWVGVQTTFGMEPFQNVPEESDEYGYKYATIEGKRVDPGASFFPQGVTLVEDKGHLVFKGVSLDL